MLEQSIADLLKSLESPDGLVRAEAARILITKNEYRDLILSALLAHHSDPEWMVRYQIARAVTHLDLEKSEAIPLLRSLLIDDEQLVRNSAECALRELGEIGSIESPRGSSFTDDELEACTNNILLSARNEAAALGHEWVGPEHLLLALTGGGNTIAARVLAAFGVSHEELSDFIIEICDPTSSTAPSVWSPGMYGTVERATAIARERDAILSPEDFLLALITAETSYPKSLLRLMQVDIDTLRSRLEQECRPDAPNES